MKCKDLEAQEIAQERQAMRKGEWINQTIGWLYQRSALYIKTTDMTRIQQRDKHNNKAHVHQEWIVLHCAWMYVQQWENKNVKMYLNVVDNMFSIGVQTTMLSTWQVMWICKLL